MRFRLSLMALLWAFVSGFSAQATPYTWNLPQGFPLPLVPADNPMTLEKVTLGRHLFFDKRLSANGQISCATCHEPRRAFSDCQERPLGVTGEKHPRNSMALTNVAYAATLTWANPQMVKLETQMLAPLLGETPPEMGMAGHEAELLQTLSQDPRYAQLFRVAFPEDPDPFRLLRLTQAIASFERSLVSASSPYDRYRYFKDRKAISAAAQRGESLFFSERLECFHCHGGFNFSDSTRHAKTTFADFSFHNTGLYNLQGQGAYPYPNTGLYDLTHRPEDMGKFKAPTLRNIALTAPYMHDGSVATLEDVIEHYAAGGRTISEGPHAGMGSKNPYKSGFVKGFKLNPQEKTELLAFLHSLTDSDFISNPSHQDPWPHASESF
jgi:cytochrome c peroxidase